MILRVSDFSGMLRDRRIPMLRRVKLLFGVVVFCLFWIDFFILGQLSHKPKLFRTLRVLDHDAFYGQSEIQRQYIYHVSKECAPLVAFGGVGHMLGELVDAQATTLKNTSTVVILPKYGFLGHANTVVARVSYTNAFRRLHSDIYMIRHDNDLTFYLVSAPSNHPLLWSSTRVENVYNLPRGLKADTRDLYFTFIAGEIIKAMIERHPSRPAYVHSHGATNAPVNYYLRLAYPSPGNLKLIYTAHDYNSEPTITYRSTEVERFAPLPLDCEHQTAMNSHPKSMFFGCNPLKEHPETQFECLRGKRLFSTYFVSCADAFSAVSSGMKSNLMRTTGDFAFLLLSFEKSRYTQVRTIGNWVSNELWKSARKQISLHVPSQGKQKAKLELSDIFHQHGAGSFSPDDCVVGWTGRFERNKGSRLLPSILQVACDAGCILAISGYSTNEKMHKDFEKGSLRLLKDLSAEKSCSFFFLGTKEDQLSHSMVVRAATDIMIVPSYSEGFGLVAAEALAFGSILVVSEVGGLPDIVRPLEKTDDGLWTGLTFPVFEQREDTTLLSSSYALFQAIQNFKSVQSLNGLSELQSRIIKSTPLRGKSLEQYNALYDSIVQDKPSDRV